MNKKRVTISLGCGNYILPTVFITLFLLKLFANINISWLLVFSPILLEFSIIIIAAIIWMIILWKKI